MQSPVLNLAGDSAGSKAHYASLATRLTSWGATVPEPALGRWSDADRGTDMSLQVAHNYQTDPIILITATDHLAVYEITKGMNEWT